MTKKTLLHGLSAGFLSAIACLFYSEIYNATSGADFSEVINIFPVIITCIVGCMIAAAGNLFLAKWIGNKNTHEIIFNIIFLFLTFISCIYPLSVRLPYEKFDFPQLFNGLVIPMHFFPVLFWIALSPVFKKS